MDSLTQIALGAAVGEAVLGRTLGNRAIMWGALLGTLPDLDSFVPFDDPIATMTYHRSATHSLLVMAMVAPFVAWALGKMYRGVEVSHARWLLMVYLVFASHALLDAFTVYGTQLLWPILEYPVSWSTVFIIDPAYTLPLVVSTICVMLVSRTNPRRHWLNIAGLTLSSLYLAWSVSAKLIVEKIADTSLEKQGIKHYTLMSTPTPFNTLLWRIIVKTEHGYYDGFYSVFDKSLEISFRYYRSDEYLLSSIEDHWPVKRLQWFTHGFYKVYQDHGDVVMADLRMGLEPLYRFSFKVGEKVNNYVRPAQTQTVNVSGELEQIKWVWHRLTNPQ